MNLRLRGISHLRQVKVVNGNQILSQVADENCIAKFHMETKEMFDLRGARSFINRSATTVKPVQTKSIPTDFNQTFSLAGPEGGVGGGGL